MYLSKTTIKNVPTYIFSSPEDIGLYLSEKIIKGLCQARKENTHFVLGCPGGRSLQCLYSVLGKVAFKQNSDLSDLVIVMMDEYLLCREGKCSYCPATAHYSCRNFALENISKPINQYLADAWKIKESNVLFPDPDNPEEYDKKIKGLGGVDIFLVASGASDGHVAFNPSGTPINSYSRIVKLAEATRIDNMKTFPQFRSMDEVPEYGVSVGLGTIWKYSKEVILVMHGKDKQKSLKKIIELGEFSSVWPASVIFKCSNPSVVLDIEISRSLRGSKR